MVSYQLKMDHLIKIIYMNHKEKLINLRLFDSIEMNNPERILIILLSSKPLKESLIK